nr:integrase, catalytic region, zinc finger, CCHC-type, peptidase aspartic, catalytic [Tanacetum cinerariifolium]
MTESPLVDSGFVVPVFSLEDDPIACLNKEMAFLTAVAFSRFPSTNNQLRTSSNPRNQATIQDGRFIVLQVQGRQGQSYFGIGYKSNATSSEGNNPKRLKNAAWYKDKGKLADAHEVGQVLDEVQLAFLADPWIPDGQAVQTIILNNAAFQTEDLDTYDSDCDDVSNAKEILMANISNYASDVILKTNVQDTNLQAQQDSMILFVIEHMSEQMINHVNNWEKANKEQNNESVTAELKRYKKRVKTLKQRLNIDLSSREKMIDYQMDDMIKEKLALKEQVDSLEQNLSNQIKEKELGQSAHTMHMLTKPQAFYDNIHKQALGYQNACYLKNAQRIKPTLYDGIVISNKHAAMPVIDDEETLILEDLSRSKMAEKDKDPEDVKRKNSNKPIEFFEKNDLKARLQDKDTTICKLKDILKSMREKSKDENVNYDYVEIETKNVELKNSVAKLILENERLCNEINHVKQDLKAQIQDLRKIKGKEIVDIATQKPSANTIVPGMFKLDLIPLAPKLLQNKEAHIDYLKYTQEQAIILWGIVEQAKAKQPLDNALDFDCNKKNDRKSQTPSRNMKNKVKAQPRNVNKHNRVVEPIRNVDVKKSQLNVNSKLVCATCEKSVFDGVHDMCLLDFVKNMNSRAKSAKTHKKIFGNLRVMITSANVVPPKQTNSHSVEIQKPELKVYNRKPKTVKNVGSSKKDKIVEYKNANHSEPNHTWGSNATIIQSSSSLVMTCCPDCSLVQLDSGTTILQGSRGVDLISGSRDINLYTISLDDMLKTSLICLLSKASKTKSWLWHRRLSHLNFCTLNKLAKDCLARGIPRLKFQKDHMCSARALGKSKKSSHQPKAKDTNQEKLYLLHMDLCGPMRVASINGKRYILVIVDDYLRFTWVRFLRSKDEAPEAIIKCIKNIQARLNAIIRNVRTYNGTEFVNQTLREFYENVRITHQTSVARTH